MPERPLYRSVGALLGLAVGDALGAPFEGLDRDSYPRVSDYAEGGAHGIKPGAWTDDTAMAICLAESLLARDRVDEHDLLERFLRWYRMGENSATGAATGVSEKTRATLATFERSRRIDAAVEVENAGNGAIMRLAPIAILFRGSAAEARDSAVRQARVTHTASAALEAAELFAELLVVALQSGDLDTVLRRAASAGRPNLAGISGFRTKTRDQISSAPRAVDTLEAALWCLERAGNFEGAVVEAVNLGGDTDTIGAVAGQLAGAIFGASAIPSRWLATLASQARLAELARQLHEREPVTNL
jgi:ADP-ribosyl-[dinitrogen reductase] hydrolase